MCPRIRVDFCFWLNDQLHCKGKPLGLDRVDPLTGLWRPLLPKLTALNAIMSRAKEGSGP